MYRAGRAAGDLRQHNRAVVLGLIRTRGPLSRTELTKAARLSMAAMVEIVGELIEEGLVREVGRGPSTGGRRPTLVELASQARSAVGIEVGTRTLTAVATDLNASVKLRVEMPSEMARGPEALVGRVKRTLREVLEDVPEGLGGVLGIGLALPAPILSRTGLVFSPPSYPDWGELRLGRVVADEYGLPVLVDNDANAAALGEYLFGAGREVLDMFYLLAHRGVGGAVVTGGKLYRGADGGAGEVGHMLVDVEGPRCGCGRHGCLEAFAGRAAIGRRMRRALKLAGGRKLAGKDVEDVTAEDVIRTALEGDELAREILEGTGRYLGIGISNVVNLLNPELVVLGGSTMRAGDLVLRPAEEVVRRRAIPEMAERVRVVQGELGEDAGSVGAAALVLNELFAVPLSRERKESTFWSNTGKVETKQKEEVR